MTAPSSVLGPRLLGRAVAKAPDSPRVIWIPWGRATEVSGECGLTALACAAFAGADGFRVGYRWSAVAVPAADSDLQPGAGVLSALRRMLAARRTQRMGDRGWHAERAIHMATWGEACVDALPAPAAAAAITDNQIVRRSQEIADCVQHHLRAADAEEPPPDILAWRGGLYCGVRDQMRLAVGVRVPLPALLDPGIVASHLGRVGAPGILTRTLTERHVPHYAAAATPVREHGTVCLGIGLSTTAEHVVALLEVVRELLRRIDDVPAAGLPFLRESAALYEAIKPSAGPFDHPVCRPAPVTCAPAVAVVGRLPEETVADLQAFVHD
jgi:hypothetical protein